MRFLILPKPISLKYDTRFVNCWIVFQFWLQVPMTIIHILTIGILKTTNLDVSLSSKGALSAIPTREGIALSENWPASLQKKILKDASCWILIDLWVIVAFKYSCYQFLVGWWVNYYLHYILILVACWILMFV